MAFDTTNYKEGSKLKKSDIRIATYTKVGGAGSLVARNRRRMADQGHYKMIARFIL
jgi:hypothetical protein